jgi:hypothetical protein
MARHFSTTPEQTWAPSQRWRLCAHSRQSVRPRRFPKPDVRLWPPRAHSAPTRVASGGTGVRATAAIYREREVGFTAPTRPLPQHMPSAGPRPGTESCC